MGLVQFQHVLVGFALSTTTIHVSIQLNQVGVDTRNGQVETFANGSGHPVYALHTFDQLVQTLRVTIDDPAVISLNTVHLRHSCQSSFKRNMD